MPIRTSPPPSSELKEPSFVEYEIGNLLTSGDLLTIKDSDHPIVYIELVFRGGRVSESILGTSWYSSKMLLEGTEKSSAFDISSRIENLGSYIEISPGIDYAGIKIYSLKKNLDKTLDILKECLLNTSLPDDEFEILKSIRFQNLNNQWAKNSSFANLQFHKLLFGEKHPYGSVISPDYAASISLDDVRDHLRSSLFTDPKIIIAGDFDDSVFRNVKDILTELNSEANGDTVPPINSTLGKSTLERENSNQASLRIGMQTIDKKHPDFHKLNIANTLLGGFFGSRLMKSIREEKGLTYGIYSSISHLRYSSYWMIGAEIEQSKVDEAIAEINRQTEALINQAPEEAEIDLLRNYLIGKFQSSMDSLFSIINLYKSLFLSGLDINYLSEYFTEIDNIKPEDVSEMIGNYLLNKEKVELIVR